MCIVSIPDTIIKAQLRLTTQSGQIRIAVRRRNSAQERRRGIWFAGLLRGNKPINSIEVLDGIDAAQSETTRARPYEIARRGFNGSFEQRGEDEAYRQHDGDPP